MDKSGHFRSKLDSASRATTKTLAEDYLQSLRIRGRSDSHLHNLEAVLRGYQRAAPELTHPGVPRQTEDWLAEHVHLMPSTRNRMLVMVKGLAKWALRHERISKNPLAKVELVKVPESIPPQFTVEELRTMVNAWGDPYHLRACVSVYTGMRISESGALESEKIDRAGRVIDVTGKGGKQRIIPIQAELAAILDAYGTLPPGALFPTRKANAWSEFADFIARIGLTRGERSPHSTRHSYAGIITATGMPSILLAAHMGHSSQETTAHYAQLAGRYSTAVAGWPRGEMQLLLGASSPFPPLPPPKPQPS